MANKTGYPSIDRNHEDGVSFLKKHPIIPDCSLYNLFKILNFGNNKSTIECLNLTVSVEALIKHSDVIAKSLLELGIKEGDIITICAPNNIHSIALFLAANKIGAGVSFLNAKSSDLELEYYINLFESPLFICLDKNNEEIANLKNKTHVRNIINLSEQILCNFKYNSNPSHYLGNDDTLNYSDFYALSSFRHGIIIPNNKANSNALYGFTSGSTDKTKIPVLTNKNIVASSIYMKNSAKTNMKSDGKAFVTVSFNYPYGFSVSTLMTLLSRKSVLLAPDLTLANLADYIAKKPNIIYGTPPLYYAMQSDVKIQKMDLSFIDLPISGGDSFPASKNIEATKFLQDHGCKSTILNGSGGAETNSSGSNAVGQKYNPATVGYVLVGTVVKAIDEKTKQEVKYNEPGLLCFSGKYLCKEYFKDPEKTKNSRMFDEKGREFQVTDTMGTLYPDGSMSMDGRKDRYFITFDKQGGSYKGYNDAIEKCIDTFPEVKQCVIVGKPDSTRGNVGKAYIVLNDQARSINNIEDILLARCLQPIKILTHDGEEATVLKSYETPCEFKIISALPYTRAGKIDYQKLENDTLEKYNKS